MEPNLRDARSHQTCDQTTASLRAKEVELSRLAEEFEVATMRLEAESRSSNAKEAKMLELQANLESMEADRDSEQQAAAARAGQLVKTSEEAWQLNELLEQRRREILELDTLVKERTQELEEAQAELAQTRARLQHAGEQLIEVRAAADERERGLVQDLEAALAESELLASKVLEAKAASQAAEERERALQEEVEAVRADAAAQTCSLKTELEAARQAMMAVHTDAEDKAARLLAAESEMRDWEDACRQGQAAALKWEERGRRFSAEIEALGKEAREEKERATKLEGELAAVLAAIAVEKADWKEASWKLQESMDQVCDRLRGREQELLDMKTEIDDQGAVLVQKEAEFRALIGKLEQSWYRWRCQPPGRQDAGL